MHQLVRIVLCACATAACFAFTACGGGGGSAAPSAPHAPPSVAPTAAATVIDCTSANGACPTIAIAGDAPSAGGFHGYADPSIRRDPTSGVLELAYSWPHNVADGSHVVDLHLAHSVDGGTSWAFDGALWRSTTFANPGSASYAQANDTSTETVNLLPIATNGATMWVQAHWSYLVPAGSTSIYAQTSATSYISVSAVSVAAGSPPSSLLALSSAPEARLGDAGTDSTLAPTTNLSIVSPAFATCHAFQQPAMAFIGGVLYLAVQCSAQGSPAFAVFSTTPSGTNAATWTWSYNGALATPAQAAALAASEGLPYTFFTELDFATSKSGGLLAIVSGASPVVGGIQPFVQYGCRAIPVTSLAVPALQTNASGVPIVVAKVTTSDLYASPNEGPGACSYDAAASTGIVIVHKLENDPQLGFFTSLEASKAAP